MRILQTILATFILQAYLFSGFSGETPVGIEKGFCRIKDLQVGDKVFGVNANSHLAVTRIDHTLIQKNQPYINLTIGDKIISVSLDQKFLEIETNRWTKAQDLQVGQSVRIVQFPGSAKITLIENGLTLIDLYDIRLKEDHVFYVTDLGVVVHNFALFTIGLMWTFNSLADITFSGAVFSVVTPFVCATYALFFKHGSQDKSQLGLQVGNEKITKTIYFDDQLKDCGSNNSYQNSYDHLHCLSSPASNTILVGPCNGQSLNDSTLVPGICQVISLDVNPEQGACSYSSSPKNQESKEFNVQSDCLSSTYQKESSKQPGKGAKNIKRHTIKESEHEAGKKCESDICSPPPKGPNGYFIPSDKHPLQPNGNASAGPTWEDGQKALDKSVPVFDGRGNQLKNRVVEHRGKLLILQNTVNDIWHGYYCEWKKLSEYQKKAIKTNFPDKK
ncbi:MAG: hypothetical protein NTU89_02440 [Candidatus Dependentiae bacterium]|nr:hypothetical protein [Candidatus Dependentiae bacterium]